MEFTRGDTYKFKFQRLNGNNEVITTKASKMWFTVKENYYTDKIILQKTLENNDITFDEEYYYHVTINSNDTKELSYKSYVCDIQVENNGVVSTIYKDNFTLLEEVTFEV